MTTQEVVRLIQIVPVIRAIEMPEDEKKEAIGNYIPIAISEISVRSEDFDFAIDVADYTGGSVEDQADYVLRGEGKRDCRQIINIRYGDDYSLLDKMRQVDVDEWLNNRSHTSTTIWMPHGLVDEYPRVKLVATPAVDDENIRYRYFKKNITVENFPESFIYVVVSGVVKRLVPAYGVVFNNDLETMINNYTTTGGADNPAKRDPETVRRNNSRYGKNGWS